MRGTLIIFEGLDRAGKSTQCSLLVENLQKLGRKVLHMRFPDRSTPIGKMIDSYLKSESQQEDHTIHLLFSANRWEAVPRIQAALYEGTTVVIDRYYYSGCVYSAAKENPTLSLEWARHPDEGLPRPDICIFLDISSADAAKRGGYGTERYESQQMQNRVRSLFEALRSSAEKDDFAVVNAGASIEDVQAEILQAVRVTSDKVDKEQLPLRFVEPW